MIEIYFRPTGKRLAGRPNWESAAELIRKQIPPDYSTDLVLFYRDDSDRLVQTLRGDEVLRLVWPGLWTKDSLATNETSDEESRSSVAELQSGHPMIAEPAIQTL